VWVVLDEGCKNKFAILVKTISAAILKNIFCCDCFFRRQQDDDFCEEFSVGDYGGCVERIVRWLQECSFAKKA